MRFSTLALLLPLLTAPAYAASADSQSVELRFLPRPGDKLRQTVEMKMQMAMNMLPGTNVNEADRAKLAEGLKKMPKGMDMDMSMSMRMEASDADAKGDYLLHLRGENGSMHLKMADTPPKEMPNVMGGMEVDALTNQKDGGIQILRVKSDMAALKDPKVLETLAQGVLKQAFGAMAPLEGRRMKIGETAEIPFDLQMPVQQLPQNAHIQATIVLTLKSIDHGVAHFDTTMKMTMEMTPGANPSADASKNINVELSGSGKGTMDYRVADHLPLRQEMEVIAQINTKLPTDVSMQMDMQMQMQTRGERYH